MAPAELTPDPNDPNAKKQTPADQTNAQGQPITAQDVEATRPPETSEPKKDGDSQADQDKSRGQTSGNV